MQEGKRIDMLIMISDQHLVRQHRPQQHLDINRNLCSQDNLSIPDSQLQVPSHNHLWSMLATGYVWVRRQ